MGRARADAVDLHVRYMENTCAVYGKYMCGIWKIHVRYMENANAGLSLNTVRYKLEKSTGLKPFPPSASIWHR